MDSIYCGDNLKVLRDFPDECVDLIYIDPPFFSGKNYDLVFDDKFAVRAFKDTFEGKRETYLSFMESRIREIHRILKLTGSFYLHCDHHANAHLRIMCDKIFGKKNFRRQIIWNAGSVSGFKSKVKGWVRQHDIILFYTKTNKYTFNKQYIPYREEYKKKFKYKDEDGRLYRKRRNGKQYLDERKGTPMGDVWNDIWSFQTATRSKEYMGYPTQKPEKLLERIIKASSNEGDIVLDAFCGCGTTLAASKRLNRSWIGIDVSPIGCTVMAKRLEYPLKDIHGMKYSLEQAKEMDWMDFQKWAIKTINGIPLTKRGADTGIDGWQNRNKFKESVPIEVKQGNISRPHVQKFNSVIEREKKKGGFMIGFKITKPATIEAKRIKRENNREIIFITFDEFFKDNILIDKGAVDSTQLDKWLKIYK